MPVERVFDGGLNAGVRFVPMAYTDTVLGNFLKRQAGPDEVRPLAPDILDIVAVVDQQAVIGIEQREPVIHGVDRIQQMLMRLTPQNFGGFVLDPGSKPFGYIAHHDQRRRIVVPQDRRSRNVGIVRRPVEPQPFLLQLRRGRIAVDHPVDIAVGGIAVVGMDIAGRQRSDDLVRTVGPEQARAGGVDIHNAPMIVMDQHRVGREFDEPAIQVLLMAQILDVAARATKLVFKHGKPRPKGPLIQCFRLVVHYNSSLLGQHPDLS